MDISKLIHVVLLILTFIVFVKPIKLSQTLNDNDVITYSMLCCLIVLMYFDPLSTLLLTIILIQTTSPGEVVIDDTITTDDGYSTSYIDTFEEGDLVNRLSSQSKVLDTDSQKEVLQPDTKTKIVVEEPKLSEPANDCEDPSFMISLDMLHSAQNNMFDEKNSTSYINIIGDSNANIQGVYDDIIGYNSLI
jgi:hypothetical protein